MGRLVLRPHEKGNEGLSEQSGLHAFPNDFLQRQLLGIMFTSNLDTDPKRKEEIDHIMDSVHLEE